MPSFPSDEIECPWCGYGYADSWELPECGTTDCEDCGKPFTHYAHVEVTYTTRRKEEPDDTQEDME